jgi:hypothetical protein
LPCTQFDILIIISVASLLLAGVVYTAYHQRVRGHLIHLPGIPHLGIKGTPEHSHNESYNAWEHRGKGLDSITT